jgi:hypothetical protein
VPDPEEARAVCSVGAELDWTAERSTSPAHVVNDKPYDSVVYGVLRSEWETRGEVRVSTGRR